MNDNFKNFLTGLIILKYCDDKIRDNNKQRFNLWRNKYHYARANEKCFHCYRKITDWTVSPDWTGRKYHKTCSNRRATDVENTIYHNGVYSLRDECRFSPRKTKAFPLVSKCLKMNIDDPHKLCDPYNLRKIFRAGDSSI